jgi:hypothetical protein
MKKIALDFDGIIMDGLTLKEQWIQKNLKQEIDASLLTKTFCVKQYGLEMYNRMKLEISDEERMACPAVKGALESIKVLSRVFEIYVISTIQQNRKGLIEGWLKRNGIDGCIVEVYSSENHSKVSIAEKLEARVLVDNDIRHLDESQSVLGIYYNPVKLETTHKNTLNVYKEVRAWSEIVEVINRAIKN